MKIVYRVVGYGFDCALFAKQERADRLVQVRRALNMSRTWGEFRMSLPAGEWDTEFAESFDEVPSDDEPFVADTVPGFADGDYPEWLLQTQLEWFPKDLIATTAASFTERHSTVMHFFCPRTEKNTLLLI